MAVKIPTFADLGVNDPQVTTPIPTYPASDPAAAALGNLGQGIQQAGTAALGIADDQQQKKTKLEQANASIDLFNRVVTLHSQISLERDPAKIAEMKRQYDTLLQTSGQAIGDPEARTLWAAQYARTIAQAHADADMQGVLLSRQKAFADIETQIDATVRTAAGSGDPKALAGGALAIDNLLETGQKAGYVTPQQAYTLRKQARSGLVGGTVRNLINQGRADEAIALLDKHPDALDPTTAEVLRARAKADNEKRGAKTVADEEWGGEDKGYTGTRGGVEGTPASGGLWARIKGAEGGIGRNGEALTSPKGAIGVSQIMPSTAREMAADLGLPYDESRLYTDQAYNERLGKGYLDKMLARYSGNEALAAAAYNAGPDRVDKWLQTIGDPRAGTITDAEFARRIPISETRNYVGKIIAGTVRAPLTAEAPSKGPIAFGDSIAAHLIRKAGIGGVEHNFDRADDSTAVSGFTPEGVLDLVSTAPEESIKGRDIILSTGASNDPNQLDRIPQQIQTLKERGARSVTILGVGTADKVKGVNDELARIASENGAAFSGPLRNVAGDGIHSSDPKAELAAVREAMPTAGSTSPSPAQQLGALPDIDAMTARVQARADRGEITQAQANAAAADLRARFNHLQATQANDRAVLMQRLTNGMAMLSDGRDFNYDTAEIYHYFPKEKADEIIQQLDDAKEGGQLVTAVRTAAPTQIAQQRAQLESRLNQPNAPNYAMRRRMLDLFDKATTERAKALKDDPAGYVAQYSPNVAAFFKSIDPQDPATFNNYATAALAEQERLGVPPEKRSILPAGVAAQVASRIAAIDPAKQNPGETLSAAARSYGLYWPQVLGDLAKAKLPGTYQVLATMDLPEQGVAASDLSRAIGLIAEKDGMSVLKKAVPDAAQKAIDQKLDEALSEFRESVGYQASGSRLYANVRDAAQALAYYYGFRGKSDGDAVQAAVDGIINAKYDFGRIGGTTVRVPKGMLATVEQATETVRAALSVSDFGEVPGNPLLTPEQRKEIWIDAIRKGGWANNGDDSGIVLMGRFRDNQYRAVRRADGSRIEVKFANAPTLAASRPASAASPFSLDYPPFPYAVIP